MNLGDRIKSYENVSNNFLTNRSPVFIRIDGKCFHSFTKKMQRPFDMKLIESMIIAGEKTAKEMMCFKLGYQQSDEFTFMLLNNENHDTQSWYNNEINKLVSISASLFTAYFNKEMGGTTAVFDSRAFNVPYDDFPNVFIWRQRDWERNSLQMYSRSFYSQKELEKKKRADMHELLYQKGANWNNLDDILKNGTFITVDGKRINKKMNYEDILTLIK